MASKIYVNAEKLPQPKDHYVLWLDVMGVQSIMSRSLPVSANYIFKFHSAALDAKPASLDIFPVMDGLYAVTPDQDALKQFLREIFDRLANTFVSEKEEKHRFLARGSVAYGPTVRGSDVTAEAVPTIAGNKAYAATLLLGMPIIQAHLGEAMAPPFGIFVAESARAFSPAATKPFNEVWWRWFEPANHALAVKLRKCLESYYKWCAAHALPILYNSERIEAHREMIQQFLPES